MIFAAKSVIRLAGIASLFVVSAWVFIPADVRSSWIPRDSKAMNALGSHKSTPVTRTVWIDPLETRIFSSLFFDVSLNQSGSALQSTGFRTPFLYIEPRQDQVNFLKAAGSSAAQPVVVTDKDNLALNDGNQSILNATSDSEQEQSKKHISGPSQSEAELPSSRNSLFKINVQGHQESFTVKSNSISDNREDKVIQDGQQNKQERISTDSDIPSKQDASQKGPSDGKPIVTYDHGQLTITAENVTLSDILSTLHLVMGTEVDLPAGATRERIWAHLGPGPARKILADLLSNTDLNYVIQASPKDLNGIQSVMLTVRTDGGGAKPEVNSQSASLENDRKRGNADAPEVPAEAASVPQEPQAAAEATPTPLPDAPIVEPHPAIVSANSPAASSVANPSIPSVLSEEQIVQQLTNMYQQRKQLQQPQAPANPN